MTGVQTCALPISILVDLHADPFEAAVSRGHSYEYDKWAAERMFVFVPAQAIVAEFMGTFKEYPPRMKAASFSLDRVMEELASPPDRATSL